MNPDEPRVLVVEDDGLMRQMIARALGKNGWCCDCAADGVEGLERSRQTAYEVIVTDLGMPGLDGHGFIADVRRAGKNVRTPILVVSCRVQDPAKFVREHPVQGYLPKPFGLEDLLKSVSVVSRGGAFVGRTALPESAPSGTALGDGPPEGTVTRKRDR
jgi:DNA-binding response OmpR family regulator